MLAGRAAAAFVFRHHGYSTETTPLSTAPDTTIISKQIPIDARILTEG